MPEILQDSRLTFDPTEHRYFYDGREVPSVTRLLGDYGLIDLSNIPDDKLEWKAGLGTAVHYAAHLYDTNNLDEASVDPRIKSYLSAYIKFRTMTGFVPNYSELRLYSREWHYAGSLDKQGTINGILLNGKPSEVLVDLKCTTTVYPSAGPQLAAYQMLFEGAYKIRIKSRLVVQLKEDGTFRIVQFSDPGDRNIFLSCVQLHYWKQKHGITNKRGGGNNGTGGSD